MSSKTKKSPIVEKKEPKVVGYLVMIDQERSYFYGQEDMDTPQIFKSIEDIEQTIVNDEDFTLGLNSILVVPILEPVKFKVTKQIKIAPYA